MEKVKKKKKNDGHPCALNIKKMMQLDACMNHQRAECQPETCICLLLIIKFILSCAPAADPRQVSVIRGVNWRKVRKNTPTPEAVRQF